MELGTNAFLVWIAATTPFAVSPTTNSTCALPLVAKKSVAIAMFNAIADGVESKDKRRKYTIEVADEGDKWTVFEALRNSYSIRDWFDQHGKPMETVSSTFGGGGLQMSIKKCTAAISNAAFEK